MRTCNIKSMRYANRKFMFNDYLRKLNRRSALSFNFNLFKSKKSIYPLTLNKIVQGRLRNRKIINLYSFL